MCVYTHIKNILNSLIYNNKIKNMNSYTLFRILIYLLVYTYYIIR